MLDDRFIEWLADTNGDDDYNKLVGKRYLEISECEGEFSLCEFNSLKEIKQGIAELDDEELGDWPLIAIFDLQARKEVKFKIVTKISFKK